MLYLFGGSPDLATSLNDFWRFDLSTRRFENETTTKIVDYFSFKLAKDSSNGHLSTTEMFIDIDR